MVGKGYAGGYLLVMGLSWGKEGRRYAKELILGREKEDKGA